MIFQKQSVKQFCEKHRQEILEWYAATQPQGEYIDMEKAFVDLKGRQYYRFATPQKSIPMDRLGKMQDYVKSMSSGLDDSELRLILDAVNTEMAKAFSGKQCDVLKVGALLNEIENRLQMVLHAELLYNFMAVQYVMEGEPKSYVVDSIHMDKVASMKDLVRQNQDYTFFQCPELSKVNEYLKFSEQEWETSIQSSIREINRLQKKVRAISEWKGSAPKTKIVAHPL